MSATRVKIEMTEEITYARTFTFEELADLLGIPRVEPVERFHANVLAALDTSNENYGLIARDDETLLNAIVVPGEPVRYMLGIGERSWSVEL